MTGLASPCSPLGKHPLSGVGLSNSILIFVEVA